MRQLMLISVLVLLAAAGMTQQIYQFSQYQQNLYILNTASAGVHDYLELNLSYRQQWVGITNSPTTYYVSANMPLGDRTSVNPKVSSSRISSPSTYNTLSRKSFHAVGFLAAQDSYGPFTQSIMGASYAFHLPVADELTISFSPSVSYNSMTFDPNKAEVEVVGDPTYANYLANRNQSNQLDINVAFWFYHPQFFVGYSTDQLVQDRLNLTNQATLQDLKAHHMFIAGYKIRLNRHLVLTPGTMLKYVHQAQLSADINLRLDIQERYWAGITYRNSNTLAGMLGMYLNNTFRLGYAFDFTMSSIQTQNVGSHEVIIGINLINKEKAVF